MTIRTRVAASGAAAVLAFGLAACGTTSTTSSGAAPTSSTSNPTSMATPMSSAPMTASSGAGMPMSSAAMTGMMSSTAATAMPSAPAGPHNQADTTFAQMMLVHHQGAVEMADLAPSRAASSKVKDLAVKIKAEQTPEIAEMNGWLAAWMPASAPTGMPMSSGAMQSMPGMDGGGSSAMPGMMSPAQMNQLKAAKGAAFDKMFLQMMITHHQGALTMAKTEKTSGQNTAALKLADSIIASQTAEIAVMQDLLKGM